MEKGFFGLLSVIAPLFLQAHEQNTQLLRSISEDLGSYKKIATKTNKNEHYQPYIISTLESKALIKLGISTLGEAIELVPGVDFSSDNLAYKTAIFRGSNPTAFGQTTLLIDGVAVNNIYFDGYSEYLDFPIELIKRIEVIRGPGSKSGEVTPYAGSINVVTYAEDNDEKGSVFGKIGSDGLYGGGFYKGIHEGDLSLFTDFYYQEDDSHIFSNSDALKSGIFNIRGLDNSGLTRSDDAPLWLKNYSLGVAGTYGDFGFKGRIYQYEKGAAFGFNYILPEYDDSIQYPNHYGEFSYAKGFADFEFKTKIGVKSGGVDSSQHLAPDGIELPKLSNPRETVVFIDGIYGEHEALQRSYYHASSIGYHGFDAHEIHAGYVISRTDTTKVVTKITNRDTGVGIVDYSKLYPFFDDDASRDTALVTLEDKYKLSDQVQFLSALSYENNSQITPKLDPKLSMVYMANSQNIFKALYAASHRTPSWQELYTLNNNARVGNLALDAERIHTFEGAYIHHFSHDNFVQATLFYLINQNQIHNITPNRQYINSDHDNALYGAEVEYSEKLSSRDSLHLNLSYLMGENSYDQSLSQVSQLLAKGYYIYDLREDLSLSGIVKYASAKDRFSYDTREELKDTLSVDGALYYKNFRDDYRVSFAVKNIFDEALFYASKPFTYEEDYPTAGRSFMLSFSKEF